MLTVANPVYDIVFKYLMEDERIVKTILSALLKKEVVEVKLRPHEYSNIGRNGLSVFRIDFGATIQEDDGSLHLVLIELQKTWVETETLRFRQYLGAQYANPDNMQPDNDALYGVPMMTVYLLGHKVGDIEEPVLYVRRQAFDYDEHLVTKGLPDPFVDSLTHDSIIVQIPRLHGQINNRLDKVLSIFDQSRIAPTNKHVLNIDETAYVGDQEMQRIIQRLVAAASDAQVRHDMNVEDEYFSVIEKRDTAIMLRDREIAEQVARIAEQKARIAEQNSQIAEKNSQIAEQNSQIEEQNSQIAEKDSQIAEKNSQIEEKNSQIAEKNSQIEEKNSQISEKNSQIEEKNSQIAEKNSQIEEKNSQIAEKNSQIEEKNSQIAEQKDMLRTSVQMLVKAGLSPEMIATSMDKDITLIRQLLEETD